MINNCQLTSMEQLSSMGSPGSVYELFQIQHPVVSLLLGGGNDIKCLECGHHAEGTFTLGGTQLGQGLARRKPWKQTRTQNTRAKHRGQKPRSHQSNQKDDSLTRAVLSCLLWQANISCFLCLPWSLPLLSLQ